MQLLSILSQDLTDYTGVGSVAMVATESPSNICCSRHEYPSGLNRMPARQSDVSSKLIISPVEKFDP